MFKLVEVVASDCVKADSEVSEAGCDNHCNARYGTSAVVSVAINSGAEAQACNLWSMFARVMVYRR